MYTSSGGSAPAPAPAAASPESTQKASPAESGYGPGTEQTPTTHN